MRILSIANKLTHSHTDTQLCLLVQIYAKAAEGGLGWGQNHRGSGGQEFPSTVQGRSPGRGSGGRSPSEAGEF